MSVLYKKHLEILSYKVCGGLKAVLHNCLFLFFLVRQKTKRNGTHAKIRVITD